MTTDSTRADAQNLPIDEAIRSAVRDAVRLHRAFNLPMCGWQDGRVVWVSPEDLPCDDLPAEPASDA